MIKNHNRKVEDLFRRRKRAGEVGIEIELEGKGFPRRMEDYWEYHTEGSLRAAHGDQAEYALKEPIPRDRVRAALLLLNKTLKAEGATVVESQRTAVHVHLNMQGLPMKKVYAVIILYLIFEDLFAEYTDASRKGNVFCLRMKDAEKFVDMLSKAAKDDEYTAFGDTGRYRYSAVNVCSLRKFNSLEFRALHGTTDVGTITKWTELLLALKDADYDNPQEIFRDFSALGPTRFTRKIFGEKVEYFGVKIADFSEQLWENLWLVQEIGYATDWQGEAPQDRTFRVDTLDRNE